MGQEFKYLLPMKSGLRHGPTTIFCHFWQHALGFVHNWCLTDFPSFHWHLEAVLRYSTTSPCTVCRRTKRAKRSASLDLLDLKMTTETTRCLLNLWKGTNALLTKTKNQRDRIEHYVRNFKQGTWRTWLQVPYWNLSLLISSTPKSARLQQSSLCNRISTAPPCGVRCQPQKSSRTSYFEFPNLNI